MLCLYTRQSQWKLLCENYSTCVYFSVENTSFVLWQYFHFWFSRCLWVAAIFFWLKAIVIIEMDNIRTVFVVFSQQTDKQINCKQPTCSHLFSFWSCAAVVVSYVNIICHVRFVFNNNFCFFIHLFGFYVLLPVASDCKSMSGDFKKWTVLIRQ